MIAKSHDKTVDFPLEMNVIFILNHFFKDSEKPEYRRMLAGIMESILSSNDCSKDRQN
jgi:hypothetical protein